MGGLRGHRGTRGDLRLTQRLLRRSEDTFEQLRTPGLLWVGSGAHIQGVIL
jgi:hypothetical protein